MNLLASHYFAVACVSSAIADWGTRGRLAAQLEEKLQDSSAALEAAIAEASAAAVRAAEEHAALVTKIKATVEKLKAEHHVRSQNKFVKAEMMRIDAQIEALQTERAQL